MKPFRFHADAEAEMAQAAAYYEAQQDGLGRRFLVSVRDALDRIALNPSLYPIVDLDVRRCIVRLFPFGILFRERADFIAVMAVMHLHRDPACWKDRLPNPGSVT
jgi:toxin ParE1/3/4